VTILLTPDLLRKAADRITPTKQDYNSDGSLFMCWAVMAVSKSKQIHDEFVNLLLEHKVIDFAGDAMQEFPPSSPVFMDIERERQAVRFMFLDFLAYWLEDQLVTQ